jgi:hypothetical protein
MDAIHLPSSQDVVIDKDEGIWLLTNRVKDATLRIRVKHLRNADSWSTTTSRARCVQSGRRRSRNWHSSGWRPSSSLPTGFLHLSGAHRASRTFRFRGGTTSCG